MAQYFCRKNRRDLRAALHFCLSLAAFYLAGAGNALTRADLYQAAAPLADRSEASQAAAFQLAMKTVLIRVTGRRSADEDPALAPLIANARRYVQQYRAASDNHQWVSFDGPAIERWLTQNSQPVWGADRPKTLVLLANQTGALTGSVVSAEDGSELKSMIEAAASLRGLPLLWPSAADLQRNHLDYASFVASGPAALGELGRRLGGEGVLIGRANNSGAGVRWTHLFRDRSNESSGTLEGVNRAADLYAGLFAASGNLVPTEIEVTGIGDLRGYASVQTYLESLTFIANVSVLELAGDSVRFRLATRGGAESLQRALALNGHLQPIAAGDNGMHRYQLRP